MWLSPYIENRWWCKYFSVLTFFKISTFPITQTSFEKVVLKDITIFSQLRNTILTSHLEKIKLKSVLGFVYNEQLYKLSYIQIITEKSAIIRNEFKAEIMKMKIYMMKTRLYLNIL